MGVLGCAGVASALFFGVAWFCRLDTICSSGVDCEMSSREATVFFRDFSQFGSGWNVFFANDEVSREELALFGAWRIHNFLANRFDH